MGAGSPGASRRSGGSAAASMPSAFIRVHLRQKNRLRAAYRARHLRAPILPLDPPRMPQERFSPARATFFTPRHAAAHRDTPPRHAPHSPLPAHPGERAPRPAKPRSNY